MTRAPSPGRAALLQPAGAPPTMRDVRKHTHRTRPHPTRARDLRRATWLVGASKKVRSVSGYPAKKAAGDALFGRAGEAL
jgi:hypothetical protein